MPIFYCSTNRRTISTRKRSNGWKIFSRQSRKAYVVISHDRYFLDETCTRIIEIENGQAYLYKGNYSDFVIERELRRDQQLREYENQQAFINKTEQFIRKNLAGQKDETGEIAPHDAAERSNASMRFAPTDRAEILILKKIERAGINVLDVEESVDRLRNENAR